MTTATACGINAGKRREYRMLTPAFDEIGEWARASGLAVRGGFHPEAEDGVPALSDGSPAGSLVMLGFAGNQQWKPGFGATRRRTPGPRTVISPETSAAVIANPPGSPGRPGSATTRRRRQRRAPA